VRDQERASTMFEHARAAVDDEAGGRFARVNPTTVIGATPVPRYPQAGTPFQSDPCGVEPPLGSDINFVEACGTAVEIEASLRTHAPPAGFSLSPAATGPAPDAPSPLMVESDVPRSGAGPLSSETKQEGSDNGS
jgi:hypothetical protein